MCCSFARDWMRPSSGCIPRGWTLHGAPHAWYQTAIDDGDLPDQSARIGEAKKAETARKGLLVPSLGQGSGWPRGCAYAGFDPGGRMVEMAIHWISGHRKSCIVCQEPG